MCPNLVRHYFFNFQDIPIPLKKQIECSTDNSVTQNESHLQNRIEIGSHQGPPNSSKIIKNWYLCQQVTHWLPLAVPGWAKWRSTLPKWARKYQKWIQNRPLDTILSMATGVETGGRGGDFGYFFKYSRWLMATKRHCRLVHRHHVASLEHLLTVRCNDKKSAFINYLVGMR